MSPVAGKTIILGVDVLIVAADPGARAILSSSKPLITPFRVARDADAALELQPADSLIESWSSDPRRGCLN